MQKHDRLNIADLRILLTENTSLHRYHSLIPRVDQIIETLGEYGIRDQYDFFREYADLGSDFRRFASGEPEMWALLNVYFIKRGCAERKLRELTSVDAGFLERLAADGVKTGDGYITLCESLSASELCGKYGVSEKAARELLGLCDIMRVAGIKHTRSRLYIDAGYRNLLDIALDDKEHMLEQVLKHIADNALELAPPLPKEIETTIATAKTLPRVAFRDEQSDCALTLPDERFLNEIMAYRLETLNADGYINGGGGLNKYEDAQAWVEHSRNMMKAEYVKEPYVESTEFIYVRDSDRKIIGTIQVRRRLNEDLLVSGGNIGYSIRPDERRKGYGKRMLAAALDYCRWLRLDRALVTCSDTNTASRRTILSNGGVYENTLYSEEDLRNIERYWITL